jgi:hypothetical protein
VENRFQTQLFQIQRVPLRSGGGGFNGDTSPEEAMGGAPSTNYGLALFDSTHHQNMGSQVGGD